MSSPEVVSVIAVMILLDKSTNLGPVNLPTSYLLETNPSSLFFDEKLLFGKLGTLASLPYLSAQVAELIPTPTTTVDRNG